MLPVSSASTNCSCNIQIPIYGGFKSFTSYSRAFRSFSNSSKRRSISCFYTNYAGIDAKSGYINMINQSIYQYRNSMIFVNNSTESAGDNQLKDLIGGTENTDAQPNVPGFVSVDSLTLDPPFPELVNTETNPLSDKETNASDIFAGMNDSIANMINGGESVFNKSLDTFSSTLTNALTDANEAFDNVVKDIDTFINKSGDSAGNKLVNLSDELKEASGRAGFVALDLLRRTIVIVEDLLAFGVKNVGYAYGSTKEFLPQEVRDVVSLSEESVSWVLTPVGTAFRQVYIAVEGLEESLGLDPNDPLIPFVLFLGVSATLWGTYRVLKYGGYAGDLSPRSAFELLRGNKKSVVLVDIRPENLRERDGIPDLRRGARFRYASVTPQEVERSVKKQLKGGKEIEDMLVASVIRNLKVVKDRSKVLVMDADGNRSKGVARSLRKLGIKTPYQVEGGFRSWAEEGFRVKELKPETTLTILNEEAEAILEEINPTPLKLFGFGAAAVALAYSLLEWEKTLQFIAIFGIGQTIYRRVASYQDAKDLKQDVRLVLGPVSQAISWAAGKLEPSRNGLPMSPSSLDVRSRVLQAAAKHGSPPPDAQEANEDVNVSEAS